MKTIKSKTGIYHDLEVHYGRIYYLCNRAVGYFSPSKVVDHEVTCKNCLNKNWLNG